jgi:hypothetical protein
MRNRLHQQRCNELHGIMITMNDTSAPEISNSKTGPGLGCAYSPRSAVPTAGESLAMLACYSLLSTPSSKPDLQQNLQS